MRAEAPRLARLLLGLTGACAALPVPVQALDRITIVGSSTVYPFSELVAEHFAKSGPFPMPRVEATSTAEGFRLFCAGSDAATPDISNASRRISATELAQCQHNGVHRVEEIRIGYDSLILASALPAAAMDVSLEQLWRAAAQSVPIDGRLVANPYHSWHDIAPTLPARPIELIGPAPGHGTRDAFVELVLESSCKVALAGMVLSREERAASCEHVRQDGAWTDVDDLELILGKLASRHDATGILTYAYLEQFSNRIGSATIQGIAPSRANIAAGTYPISRPLFIYLKREHLASTLGLADYAAEFVSFCAAGANGYLADLGLVPLPTAELMHQRAAVARLQR